MFELKIIDWSSDISQPYLGLAAIVPIAGDLLKLCLDPNKSATANHHTVVARQRLPFANRNLEMRGVKKKLVRTEQRTVQRTNGQMNDK